LRSISGCQVQENAKKPIAVELFQPPPGYLSSKHVRSCAKADERLNIEVREDTSPGLYLLLIAI
jgi:hypothetical protein